MKFIFKTLIFSLAILAIGCKSEPKIDENGNPIIDRASLKVVKEIDGSTLRFEDGSSKALATDKSVIVMVRHAETTGEGETRLLSEKGIKRANKLRTIFEKAELGAVMSTSKVRAAMTVKRSAEAKGLGIFSYSEVNTGRIYDYVFDYEKGKTFLIAGHSNTVPAMIHELTANPNKPTNIKSDIHDDFFVLTGTGKGNCTVEQYRY